MNNAPTIAARFYALNPNAPKLAKEPTGQAARLLEELRADTTPRFAQDIDMAIATSDRPYVTRQDSLRITLYYLIIFRRRGLVVATQQTTAAENSVAAPSVDETDVTENETDEVGLVTE